MGKYLLFPSLLLPFLVLLNQEDHSSVQENYIQDYRALAVEEMERTGIPASIKLAQAILESNSGRSELATKARNHFGIKCGNTWKGQMYHLHDDDRDTKGQSMASCFRVYKSAHESYKDHSDFLRHSEKEGRYGFLFRLPPTDYVGWARGLQRAGYATNNRYATILIELIERYELHQYDLLGADASDRLAGIGRINDIRLAFARPGESIEAIAERLQLNPDRLLDYNEHRYLPDQQLQENEMVYLQPKRSFFRGRQRWHKVKEGETMATIAHTYGIKTEKLRKKNRIPDNHEPLAGAKVKLRWRVSQKEAPPTRLAGPRVEQSHSSLRGPVASGSLPGSSPEITPLPTGTTSSPSAPKKDPVPDPVNDSGNKKAIFHTVTPGETLWRIASKYNKSVELLMSLNNLSSDRISTGQRLRIQ